jgi:UDP-N-acetylmuramyl pentapeptide synthase
VRIELTIPFPLVNMISYIPISKSINLSNKQIITHICTDSRLAQKGDLFIALKGEKYDGNDFLYDANARGAISLGNQDTNADIETPSTNSALLYIAKYYKSLFKKLKSLSINKL